MPEWTALLPLIGLLLGIGAFAGIVAGLLGVGGGIVLVPAFYYTFSGLGYGGPDLMQVCLATSLATIIVTSARSVSSHHKKGAVDWDILRTWSPGIVIGAIAGVFAVSALRSEILVATFAILGMGIGLYMVFGRSDWRLSDEMPVGPARAGYSGAIGFVSVLMGIGGGSLAVPIMTLHGRPIHRAVATAAGFGGVIALPSVIGFLLTAPENAPPYSVGAVNMPAFLLVISMTLLTAPIGARIAHALDPKPLKRVFAVFIIIVALNMLRKVLGW